MSKLRFRLGLRPGREPRNGSSLPARARTAAPSGCAGQHDIQSPRPHPNCRKMSHRQPPQHPWGAGPVWATKTTVGTRRWARRCECTWGVGRRWSGAVATTVGVVGRGCGRDRRLGHGWRNGEGSGAAPTPPPKIRPVYAGAARRHQPHHAWRGLRTVYLLQSGPRVRVRPEHVSSHPRWPRGPWRGLSPVYIVGTSAAWLWASHVGRRARSTWAMTLLPLLLGRDSSTPRFLCLSTRKVVSIHLNSVAQSRDRAFAGPYGRFRSPVGPQSPASVLRLRFPHNHAACDVPCFRTRTRCDHSGSLRLHVVTAAVVRVLQHVVPAMR